MKLYRGAFALLALICCSCKAQNFNSTQALVVPVKDTEILPPKTRIIGGTKATKHQFPYQVAIITDGRSFCGGSLISNNTVLTAAHCTYNGKEFQVHLGAHQWNVYEADRQTVMSTSATEHENYTQSYNFDIAIIHLSEEISGEGVASVRLPTKSQASLTFQGKTATVSGWGLTEISSERNDILLYVNLAVIENTRCKLTFGSRITDSHICTESMGGTKGTCNGDSGGPLVITDDDGEPTLIGIVSFGAPNCMANAPSAYTRVTSYLDWIDNQTGSGGTRQFSRLPWLLPIVCITYKILI